jgi:hypothetical protein
VKHQQKHRKDYSWFKFLANNRKISQRHIKDLEKEFDAYGNITEISPITVNTHGFIIDGQHRYLICEKRGLEVYYIEVDAQKEITPAMNSKQKRWSAMDYIEFYAAYKPEYELLRRFILTNDVTFPVASAVLFSNLNRKFVSDRKLKDGTLEVSPFLKVAQKNIDIISEIGEKMGAVLTERYVRGLVRCLAMEDFDLQRFMKKLDIVMRVNPHVPNPRLAAIEDVMRNIESIYNFQAGERQRTILFR